MRISSAVFPVIAFEKQMVEEAGERLEEESAGYDESDYGMVGCKLVEDHSHPYALDNVISMEK